MLQLWRKCVVVGCMDKFFALCLVSVVVCDIMTDLDLRRLLQRSVSGISSQLLVFLGDLSKIISSYRQTLRHYDCIFKVTILPECVGGEYGRLHWGEVVRIDWLLLGCLWRRVLSNPVSSNMLLSAGLKSLSAIIITQLTNETNKWSFGSYVNSSQLSITPLRVDIVWVKYEW